MSSKAQNLEARLQQQLGEVVFGMSGVIHHLLIALISRGHVLLQGPPGLGKTLLSKSLAAAVGGRFQRIQGTADLMPSDITGVYVYDENSREFVFRHGPLFADIILVDEINRAGPKTQSALLEAMEERQVTVDLNSFDLPADFLVVATQNPHEFEGTYPLPESQLDRFMLTLELGYTDRQSETRVLESYAVPGGNNAGQAGTELCIDAAMLAEARRDIEAVHLSPELVGYVLDIAQATRDSERLDLGLSTRGALGLALCARVEAGLRGGDYVVPDDVKKVAHPVMCHRLVLTPDSILEGVNIHTHLDSLLDSVAVPH